MAATVLEWLKVLGPLLLAVVVAIATWQFQKWQVRLAKQKLRHDLYDRRLAIYVAFQELLLALPEKSGPLAASRPALERKRERAQSVARGASARHPECGCRPLRGAGLRRERLADRK